MAAALTLLGVIEAAPPADGAWCCSAGTVLLTLGRGLAHLRPAGRDAAPCPPASPGGLIAAGLLLLALAALLDAGRRAEPRAGPRDRRPGARRRPLLPHLALLLAAVVDGRRARSPGAGRRAGAIAGMVVCVVLAAVHRWLTAREEQRLTARLRRSEAYFRSLVQSAGDAVVILDDDLRITWASPALERALGDAAAELVGRPLLDAVHPDDAAALAAALPGRPAGRRVTDAGGRPADRPAARRGGGVALPGGRRSPTCAAIADVGAVVLHCRDMTDRHAREQALQSVAYTDPMTGLPNRAGFLRLVRAGAGGRRPAPSTLLLIELDGLAAARENAGREVVSHGRGRDRPAAARHRARRGRRRPHGRRRLRRPRRGQRRRRRPAGRPVPVGRRAADRSRPPGSSS